MRRLVHQRFPDRFCVACTVSSTFTSTDRAAFVAGFVFILPASLRQFAWSMFDIFRQVAEPVLR